VVWSAAGAELIRWRADTFEQIGTKTILLSEDQKPLFVNCLLPHGPEVLCATGKSIIRVDTASCVVTGHFPPSAPPDPGELPPPATPSEPEEPTLPEEAWVLVDEEAQTAKATPPRPPHEVFGGAMSPTRERRERPRVSAHSLCVTAAGELWCASQHTGTVQIFDLATGEKRREWVVDCTGIYVLLIHQNGTPESNPTQTKPSQRG
jgi:hypothetical protein